MTGVFNTTPPKRKCIANQEVNRVVVVWCDLQGAVHQFDEWTDIFNQVGEFFGFQ
jgi:hypothetical protein